MLFSISMWFNWIFLLMILEYLSINLLFIMNSKDIKKFNCRFRELLKRRRKQRKMKKKEKVREIVFVGRC